MNRASRGTQKRGGMGHAAMGQGKTSTPLSAVRKASTQGSGSERHNG